MQDLSDEDLAALLTMALAPEEFDPQEYEEEVPDMVQKEWPNTISNDRRQAKIHALSFLKEMPHLQGIVYANLKWIKGKAAKKVLGKKADHLPPRVGGTVVADTGSQAI